MIIGIDLGTTGCRSMVFDEQLTILGESYIEYPLIQISEREIEQDADLWWELVKTTIGRSISHAGINGTDIKSISISSQGIAFVPVDRNCRPLRNAISWLDTRATEEISQILTSFSEHELFRITGKRASEGYLLPKLMWLKKHEPAIYTQIFKILMPHDFILCKLCGRFVTDHTMASGSLLYDVVDQKWSRKILDEFAIDESILPEIEWSGTAVGRIDPVTASETGISKDAMIVVGGQDQKCAALGAGISNSSITVSLGTATAIIRKWDFPHLDSQMRIPLFTDLIRGYWVSEGVIGTAGAALKWLRNTFFEGVSFEELSFRLHEFDRGSNLLFYPHLTGVGSPEWLQGSTGCYYGINLSTGKYDFVQALFEGIAYQIRNNVESMENSERTNELRIFGGGARSAPWCQIISDVTGKNVVTLATIETACVGAAILAGIGAGTYKNLAEIDTLIKVKAEFAPDPIKEAHCEETYRQYREIEKKLWQ